ncbi:MAG: prephenate dehydratase [Pontibacterium sp.]
MSEQEKELRVLRDRIDAIDSQIHQLLNDRARCAQSVAEVKLKYQGVQNAVFYRPEREAQVLRKVMERNEGPLPDEYVARLFREIMSVCLAYEQPMRVAFLGPEGTFTHNAAIKHFGQSAKGVPLNSLNDVFREVQAGGASYGVVPIENSSEGMETHTLDLFRRYDLKICGEVEVPVHYHLLAKQGEALSSATRVVAHQQTFAHCRLWLDQNLSGVERVIVNSSAEAAKLANDSDGSIVAIASDMAAELYALGALVKNIEDLPGGFTRFLIVGTQDVGTSGQDKTSVLVATENKAGALYRLLEPFYAHDISLTRVETRSKGSESLFYIDFEGHADDDAIAQVLDKMKQGTVELKVLGSYPQAVL